MKDIIFKLSKTLLIIPIFLLSNSLFSQDFKKEKRIYLLDITKSMWGLNGNPDIFNEIKEALFEGITHIEDPETLITIIPFQGTNTYTTNKLPSWTFKKNDKTFQDVKKVIDDYTIKSVPGHNTDIYSALQKAKEAVDSNRINYIYLLTDGKQSEKGNTIKFDERDLKTSLMDWCNWANSKDAYLFYVMLTENAENKEILGIINNQCRAFVVNGTNVDIAFIKPFSNNVMLNLHDAPKFIEVNLQANNWKYIKPDTKIKCQLASNSVFEIVEADIVINKHKIRIPIRPVNNISFSELIAKSPIQVACKLSLSTNSDIKILAPEIEIVVKNRKEKVLKLEFENNEN